MLSVFDLAAKGLGWLSLWGATSLFFPEIIHAWIQKPKQLRIDTYVFYWCWWIGDGCHLIGLHMGHGKVTQLALTWSILAFDSILIVMLTTFACVNRPRGRPLWIRRVKKPTIETLVKASSSHPSFGAPPESFVDAQPPPGSSNLEADLASLASGKGKSGKGVTSFIAKHARIFEYFLIGSLFLAVVVVWGVMDLRVKGTANPDEPSPRPSTSIDYLAWGLAFGAVPLWVGPRIVNIVVSLKDGVPEGITTPAVCLGGFSHLCNIASVLMINKTADSRTAEAPFIATAVACVFFDTVRLALKYHLTRRKGSDTAPERDPQWLDKQEKFKYNNGSEGTYRYGGTRHRDRLHLPLESKRLSFSSDSDSDVSDSSPSSRAAIKSHEEDLARRALLPLPTRKANGRDLSANVKYLKDSNRRAEAKRIKAKVEKDNQDLEEQHVKLRDITEKKRRLKEEKKWLKEEKEALSKNNPRNPGRVRRDSATGNSQQTSHGSSESSWSEEGSSSSEGVARSGSARSRRSSFR